MTKMSKYKFCIEMTFSTKLEGRKWHLNFTYLTKFYLFFLFITMVFLLVYFYSFSYNKFLLWLVFILFRTSVYSISVNGVETGWMWMLEALKHVWTLRWGGVHLTLFSLLTLPHIYPTHPTSLGVQLTPPQTFFLVFIWSDTSRKS